MAARIVSLVPGATEIVCAIGALDLLVGISHECDYPDSIQHLPRVTSTPIDTAASLANIDATVRDVVEQGNPVVAIDATLLRRLQPTVIITQLLCDVCAVADGQAIALACVLDLPPRMVTMRGRTLGGIWDDMREIGRAIGHGAAAECLANRCARDVEEMLARAARQHGPTPRAILIEWLDPLYLAGHWVPEMLAAAGMRDVGAHPGDHSTVRSWNDVIALDPDIVLVALCGFDESRARREVAAITEPRVREWLTQRKVVCIDGNAYTSRAGPRVVDGVRTIRAEVTGNKVTGDEVTGKDRG